jgi:transposase-like protein
MIQHHGEYLFKKLRKNHINVSDLARQIGVSRQTVHNWYDQIFIPKDRWRTLSEATGIDLVAEVFSDVEKYSDHPESHTSAAEELSTYLSNKISISVHLDGNDAVLEKAIQKLIKINEVLKNV